MTREKRPPLIEIVEVSSESLLEREAVSNLMQLYFYDFSEFQWFQQRHEKEGHVGPDGRFTIRTLERYWRDTDRRSLLLRSDGQIVGLSLLNKVSPSGSAIDWAMAEFFILRRFRRNGYGAAAAATIIRERPGVWEIGVARDNDPARRFWEAVIKALPTSSCSQLQSNIERWDGPIFRLEIEG